MLIDEIKEIKTSVRELRRFGLLFGGVFFTLTVVALWKHQPAWEICLMLSLFFFTAGFFRPALLKPVRKVWMILSLLMGWVMTRVILVLLFYLVIFPIGFLSRCAGKDFLDRKIEPGKESYWMDHVTSTDSAHLEKQF